VFASVANTAHAALAAAFAEFVRVVDTWFRGPDSSLFGAALSNSWGTPVWRGDVVLPAAGSLLLLPGSTSPLKHPACDPNTRRLVVPTFGGVIKCRARKGCARAPTFRVPFGPGGSRHLFESARSPVICQGENTGTSGARLDGHAQINREKPQSLFQCWAMYCGATKGVGVDAFDFHPLMRT